MHGAADRPSGGTSRAKRFRIVPNGAEGLARRSISVLIIEDDPEDLFLLRRYLSVLTAFAADVHSVDTLVEARRLVCEHSYDIIFCDFWLNNESSVPFIQDLASLTNGCPIALLSSSSRTELELIARRAGANGYLAKSDICAARLHQVISSLLGIGQQRALVVPGLGGPAPQVMITGRDVGVSRRPIRSMGVNDGSPLLPLSGQGTAGMARLRGDPPACFDVVTAVCDITSDMLTIEEAPSTLVYRPSQPTAFCYADSSAVSDLLRTFIGEGCSALERGESVMLVSNSYAGTFELLMQGHAPDEVDDRNNALRAREDGISAVRRQLLTSLAAAVSGTVLFTGQEDLEDGIWRIALSFPLNQPDGDRADCP